MEEKLGFLNTVETETKVEREKLSKVSILNQHYSPWVTHIPSYPVLFPREKINKYNSSINTNLFRYDGVFFVKSQWI